MEARRKPKMPLSGEAIRMMNYVDDVATTMRRLLAVAPMLTTEERKRVSEYLRGSSPNAQEVLTALDKMSPDKVPAEKTSAEKK
jgi:hypothetical protein